MAALQDLLAQSRRRSTEHLRSIVGEDRALSAAEVVAALGGMKVVSLATVTARGEPRVSAVDGHFLHGTWLWGTSGTSAKARHLAARPAVSLAHVDGETLAVFAHGTAHRLEPPDGRFGEAVAHLTGHYGLSPLELGPDIRLYRLEPAWMVGWAADRPALRQRLGLGGGPASPTSPASPAG